MEAIELRMDAFPSPLSTNISLSSSGIKNWKYSDCHWGSHCWECAHSASVSVLITIPLGLRLRRAPNEKRSGLQVFMTIHFLDKDSMKNQKLHSLNLFL